MFTSDLLDVENLSVTYRSRKAAVTALNSVSFTIGRGETVGIVGESGSGKTTAGRAILGLATATTGSIRLDGQELLGFSGTARRRLSSRLQVVFQNPYPAFNPSRTVGQTVAETLNNQSGIDRASIQRRVGDMLERIGMDRSSAGRYPRQFSGGQLQRLAIARALMPSPDLVICDEPVSALDLSVQAQVLNLLRDLQEQEQLAYLFISHDLSVVRHICVRVIVMRRGEIVESGTTEQVCERPQHPYTQALIAAAPVADPAVQAARRKQRRSTAA